MNPKTDAPVELIWIDTETTGLDTSRDLLLELSVVLTDRFGEIVGSYEHVISPPRSALRRMKELEQATSGPDAYVYEMHERSGLWEEVLHAMIPAPEIEKRILDWFDSLHLDMGTFPLCGNTIWFDRLILRNRMPALENWFHYRNIDISSIKELTKLLAPDLHDRWKNITDSITKPHRAMEDVLYSIKEYQHYLQEDFITITLPTGAHDA